MQPASRQELRQEAPFEAVRSNEGCHPLPTPLAALEGALRLSAPRLWHTGAMRPRPTVSRATRPDPAQTFLLEVVPERTPEVSRTVEMRGDATLAAVWGSGPSDVDAVGRGGTILHAP